jgi:hypothetical protein
MPFKTSEARREWQRKWRAKNRAAIAEYQREYHARHAERRRCAKYGITVADFRTMLAVQGHACRICRARFDGRTLPHIDHVHATGTVRGILCGKCNRGIGHLQDNASLLRRAARYVEVA